MGNVLLVQSGYLLDCAEILGGYRSKVYQTLHATACMAHPIPEGVDSNTGHVLRLRPSTLAY